MNYEKITAISTASIAILALMVSVWQVMETRSHNRKSVLPVLHIGWHFNSYPYRAGVYLENNGLGPAKLNSIALKYQNKEIVIDSPTAWGSISRDLNLQELDLAVRFFIKGTIIRADDKLYLFTLKDNHTSEQMEAFIDVVSKIQYVLEYESFYGDVIQEVITPPDLSYL